jgi:Ca-activated chloride channel family protein
MTVRSWGARLAAALAAALLASGAAAGRAAAPPAVAPRLEVRFASPAADDVLDGEATVEVAVIPHGDISVLKVDFYADEVRIGWRDDPPYRMVWDAGSSLRARHLRAVAYGSDGNTYEAKVTTKELKADFRTSVEVVNVFATVRDFGGDYVGNLRPSDFAIYEDGAEQRVTNFVYEALPLHIVFLIDASTSMEGERLATAREAAERFLRTLDPSRDRAMLITFAGDVRVDAAMTSDMDALAMAARSLQSRPGGTALYDAVCAAVDALRPIEGRKAILLLSDGRDESDDGFRPGSARSFEDSLQQAQQADVILYTIGVGKKIEDEKDFYGVHTVGEILTRYAGETGGRAFFAVRVGQLRRAYETVADALRHQYSLGYVSTNPRRDGSWRSIRVVCRREGYSVSARKGYYAPRD